MICDQEAVEVAQYIDNNLDIDSVNFTGGEPTLVIDKIKLIQENITRKLKYSMTTNGHFGSNLDFLDKIKLDKIIFSYDKFHQTFISNQVLIEAMQATKDQGLSVILNFVYSDPQEMLLLGPFKDIAGVDIAYSEVVESKSCPSVKKTFFNKHCLSDTCHAISSTSRKITYVPQKGLTPCCGPLLFDGLQDDSFIFSNIKDDYSKNPLRNKLMSLNPLPKICDDDHVWQTKIKGVCEMCSKLYERVDGFPTLEEMLNQKERIKSYSNINKLDSDKEKILNTKFHVMYLYLAYEINSEAYTSKLPATINITNDLNEYQNAIDFIAENFYLKHNQYYTAEDTENFRKEAVEYLKVNPTITVHKKNNQIVAVLLTNVFDKHAYKHAYTGEVSVHIGYWGYDKSMVNDKEALGIKSDWTRILKQLVQEHKCIDASLDFFNAPVFPFAEKLGFKRTCLRLKAK